MKLFQRFFSLSLCILICAAAQAQEILKREITLSQKKGTIEFFLGEISENTGYTFSYINNALPLKKTVVFETPRQNVQSILDELLKDLKIQYEVKGSKIILSVKKKDSEKLTVSGVVKDKSSGELLPGASIMVKDLSMGVSSNNYGFYALNVPAGSYQIICMFLGYQAFATSVDLKEDTKLDIELIQNSTMLNEVTVNAEAENENITSTQMGVIQPDLRIIKNMPAFLGEVDIVKSIIQLPGVTTVGEVSPGFNVRGGGIDQNLILLDEAPVYNSSHLFGFYSVFNPDAVKDLRLYKSAIPANYGGRLSSVLDVTQKEGNNQEFHGSGGIGLVDTRFQFEGPLLKNKSSFLLSGRRSYADLVLKPLNLLKDLNHAYFYDLNAKINYSFSTKDKVYLSGYLGKDLFDISNELNTSWGNATTTLRWNHLFSDQLFSNLTAVYSNYGYSQGKPQGDDAYQGKRGIISGNLKYDFTWYHSVKHQFDFGFSTLAYKLNPGKINPANNSEVNAIHLDNEYGFESAAYVADDYKISSRLSANVGLRYSMFQNVGPGDVYVYDPALPKTYQTIKDTLHYSQGKVIKSYGGLEPRFALTYQFSSNASFKASYNRTRQYLHFISNTTAATPVDFWKLSDPYLKPEIADQIALGYFKNIKDNIFKLSAEIYYKRITNLVDYKNGANLVLNPAIDAELLQGKGKAYGVELMLNKTKGKLTGWIGYTYSETFRLINGSASEEKINNGKWYPANYNQPNKINLVAVYDLSDRWTISTNFVYTTGRPITYPDGGVTIEGRFLPNYSSRNQSRLPDYHRLDLSVTRKGRTRPGKRWEGSWVFSLYNVYARQNVYSIYFTDKSSFNGTRISVYPEITQLSILATVFPSITYNFKF